MIYLPLKIAVGQSGAYNSSMSYSQPFDTLQKYGLYIKHSPFTIRPSAKNIISQTWKDQEGDDVFLPTKVTHEAYELELEFVYFHDDGAANTKFRNFVAEIEGKWLKIYDSYTKIGRQAVYMVSWDEDPTFKRRKTRDIVIAKVKFKVNDPDTNITL